MKHLLLTLGHNSSAILLQDGKLVAGYEEERLTGVKSDSRFPVHAIKRLMGDSKPDVVYVTHWDPTADISNLKDKYWDKTFFDGVPIRSHTDNTHHDTHALAALSFAGHGMPADQTYIFVVDGFGSYGEHFSVYRLTASRNLELVFRARGYDTSLGLLYQYATAFLGMKMHEDEYKLLGYEVRVSAQHADALARLIDEHVDDWSAAVEVPHLGSVYDPIFNLAALDATRERLFTKFSAVLSHLSITDPHSYEARTALAFYIQSVLEGCVLAILSKFDVKNLIVSGGCFYNVKLNKELIYSIEGLFCAYPLAGDQGNALGLYSLDYPSFEMPSHLYWGQRSLQNVGEVDGLMYVTADKVVETVLDRLDQCGHVNLVRGGMEFGPRALCNTSTLALPTSSVVDVINGFNHRNTVMPMAPCMLYRHYRDLYHHTDRVHKSEEFMIVAMEHRHTPNHMRGAAHHYQYPFYDHWTGRPQVVRDDDTIMQTLLNETGPLINTSFNFHGLPIAFEMPQIIQNHMLQHNNNPHVRTLVVIE